MKKQILIILFIGLNILGQSQNIQFLGGYGNNAPVNFVTTEVYKPLDRGPIYYFTDFKFDKKGNNFETYTEISKYWMITRNYISLTAQYNAGLNFQDTSGFQIKPVYLFGLSKAGKINDLILTFDVLYRIDAGTNFDGEKIGNGIQLTGTFLRDWNNFQVSGYCDLWQTENSKYYNKNNNSLIIIFEPQVWWKFSKRVYLGIEGRLSNFNNPNLGLGNYANYVMIGLKWNLEI